MTCKVLETTHYSIGFVLFSCHLKKRKKRVFLIMKKNVKYVAYSRTLNRTYPSRYANILFLFSVTYKNLGCRRDA